jgi:hypothetical protein
MEDVERIRTEIMRILSQLDLFKTDDIAFTDDNATHEDASSAIAPAQRAQHYSSSAINRYLAGVSNRQKLSGPEECGWIVMLDLYKNHGRRSISVTSACIASMHPPTTALRWISQLVEKGLIERLNDENDARRVFVQLSQEGLVMVENWVRLMNSMPRSFS